MNISETISSLNRKNSLSQNKNKKSVFQMFCIQTFALVKECSKNSHYDKYFFDALDKETPLLNELFLHFESAWSRLISNYTPIPQSAQVKYNSTGGPFTCEFQLKQHCAQEMKKIVIDIFVNNPELKDRVKTKLSDSSINYLLSKIKEIYEKK